MTQFSGFNDSVALLLIVLRYSYRRYQIPPEVRDASNERLLFVR